MAPIRLIDLIAAMAPIRRRGRRCRWHVLWLPVDVARVGEPCHQWPVSAFAADFPAIDEAMAHAPTQGPRRYPQDQAHFLSAHPTAVTGATAVGGVDPIGATIRVFGATTLAIEDDVATVLAVAASTLATGDTVATASVVAASTLAIGDTRAMALAVPAWTRATGCDEGTGPVCTLENIETLEAIETRTKATGIV